MLLDIVLCAKYADAEVMINSHEKQTRHGKRKKINEDGKKVLGRHENGGCKKSNISYTLDLCQLVMTIFPLFYSEPLLFVGVRA